MFWILPSKCFETQKRFLYLHSQSGNDSNILEKWQSGRLRQSWKLLTVTGPGVRIPLSPRNGENVKISFNEFRPKKTLKPHEVYSFNQLWTFLFLAPYTQNLQKCPKSLWHIRGTADNLKKCATDLHIINCISTSKARLHLDLRTILSDIY